MKIKTYMCCQHNMEEYEENQISMTDYQKTVYFKKTEQTKYINYYQQFVWINKQLKQIIYKYLIEYGTYCETNYLQTTSNKTY